MKIIVVGAGIGGLSAALALSLHSHQVLVLESAPALAEIGAGVQLTPDAIKFFFQWGLKDDILAKAAIPNRFVIHHWRDGEVLREINIRRLEGDYGAPYVVVHRGVLHEILHRHAVRAGAEVRVNSRVGEYDFEAGAVVLKNGHRLEADLVVACDGTALSREELLSRHILIFGRALTRVAERYQFIRQETAPRRSRPRSSEDRMGRPSNDGRRVENQSESYNSTTCLSTQQPSVVSGLACFPPV